MIDTIKLTIIDYLKSLGYFTAENAGPSFIGVWASHKKSTLDYVGTMNFGNDSMGFSGYATNYYYIYLHYYDPNLIDELTRLAKESILPQL